MVLVSQCGHCGRHGTLEAVKHVTIESREDLAQTGPHLRDVMEVKYQTVIEVARCRSCRQPSFTEYHWVDEFFESEEDALDVRCLFPPPRHDGDLPERVRKRYVDMLELLHAPDAFAVRAGRLLEAVCLDQGIGRVHPNGNRLDLANRLDLLVSKGHVPKALAAQAHLVRDYRNLGGHDEDLEPNADDVPLIRGFVESLLDFLYWGPAKLARGSADLEARRKALKAGNGPSSPPSRS
jgi:hypothetical protein